MNVERKLWQHTAGPPIEAAALSGDVKSDAFAFRAGVPIRAFERIGNRHPVGRGGRHAWT